VVGNGMSEKVWPQSPLFHRSCVCCLRTGARKRGGRVFRYGACRHRH